MKTKEAIEIVKQVSSWDCLSKKERKAFKVVFYLLEHREIFEKMWEKLRGINPPAVINYVKNNNDVENVIKQAKILRNTLMDTIEQEYFPKRINRIIEVEVEASNIEVIDELATEIRDVANSQSHRKGKIGVINTRWVRD